MAVDKELLLKGRLTEAEVPIPGVGTIRVRAMSRAEVFLMQKAKGNSKKRTSAQIAAYERKVLALGMVDPAMTEAEVMQWQDGSPAGELGPVVDKIRELSGLSEGADKSDLPGVRDESGDGVRVLPSSEAVDDGGHAAGDDG